MAAPVPKAAYRREAQDYYDFLSDYPSQQQYVFYFGDSDIRYVWPGTIRIRDADVRNPRLLRMLAVLNIQLRPDGRYTDTYHFDSSRAIDLLAWLFERSDGAPVAEDDIGACVVCSAQPNELQTCGACQRDAYCGVECQAQDWNRHREECCIKKPGV